MSYIVVKIISSYGIEIKQMNKLFRTTVSIYNKAVTFSINVLKNMGKNQE